MKMTTGIAELRDVENFLKNKGIAISCNNSWLRSCVECFRTQCNDYRTNELLEFVFEQWLLADLREVGSCSLPKECSSSEKFIVIGKHAVQLNYCLDIGTSGYSQLQKIRRPGFGDNLLIDSERETGEQPFTQKNIGRRSLKLEISDGQLTVIGFEDKPISCLKNPVPGEKALLKGPIECRKGVLMLTDRNIEILGGEVDTLLIPNAVENVLARKLGQPEDPNPYKHLIETIPDKESKMLTDCMDEDNEALLLLAESMEMSEPAYQRESGVSSMELSSVQQSTGIEDFDDDFDLIAAQTASLVEAEVSSKTRHAPSLRNDLRPEPQSQCTSTSNVAVRSAQCAKLPTGIITSTSSPDRVEYVDMNDPKRLKKELEESYGTGAPYYKAQSDSHPASAQPQGSRSYSSPKQNLQIPSSSFKLPLNTPVEEITRFKHEMGSTLSSKNSVTEKVCSKQSTSTRSFHSSDSLQEIDPPAWPKQNKQRALLQLSNVNEESPSWLSEETEDLDSDLSESEQISDNSETFHQPYPPRKFPSLRVVRGQVVRLSEKLTLKNDQWCLSAIVSAKDLEIEMSFASEVLDKIFGVTAAELIARKNDLKNNPAAKEQMNKLLRDSQLRIKNLNCEMVIRFPSVIAKPIIIDVMQK